MTQAEQQPAQALFRDRADLPESGRAIVRHDLPDGTTPRGVILMLHGGTAHSREAVGGRSASFKRSAAMHRALTSRAHEAGVSLWMLRYAVRGWNAGSPIADARWALDRVRDELGEVPVVLLGHSMGARTSVYVADDPSVVGVVGLAPWWSAEDPTHLLADKPVRAAHGRSDKITLYRMTSAYLGRAEAEASSVELTSMGRVGHYMMRKIPAWNSYAIETSLELLGAE